MAGASAVPALEECGSRGAIHPRGRASARRNARIGGRAGRVRSDEVGQARVGQAEDQVIEESSATVGADHRLTCQSGASQSPTCACNEGPEPGP